MPAEPGEGEVDGLHCGQPRVDRLQFGGASDRPAFQAFLASEEAALIQAKSGAAVPAYNGTQTAWVESAPWNLQVFLDEAENSAVPYPVSLNTAEWNQFETELLPQAFTGERPVEEAAGEMATRMNEILAGEQ
ncbi:hypothetical protein ACQBAR_12415 [Propionibacteriaceae bacterium Y1685]